MAAQIDTQGAEDGVLADFNQDGLLDIALSWFTPAAAPDPLRGGVQGVEIIRDYLRRLPSKPGVYRMIDESGDVGLEFGHVTMDTTAYFLVGKLSLVKIPSGHGIGILMKTMVADVR